MKHRPFTTRIKSLVLTLMVFGILFQPGATLYALSEEQSRIFHSGIRYYSFKDLKPREGGGNRTAGPSGPLQGCDVAEKVWNFFTGEAGLTPEQTAGIMGNIQRESGFNPGIEERSGGGGFGLVQWTGGRRTAIENAARAAGVPANDADFQIRYIWQELNGAESAALADLRRQTTVAGATESFESKYERAGIVALQERIQFANENFNRFSNGGGCG
jgi:hypothetical protein